jgi:2-succinyl-5-enolpyruvyl-6-hydroxy-3-cyclohexene-1-carboxylate synthase
MEAFYAGLPLVLMTADRPRRFRGSGAPQAAEQFGLFGIYCRRNLDLAVGDAWKRGLIDGAGPVHLNVCFEDPNRITGIDPKEAAPGHLLLAASATPFFSFLSKCRHPLVIVGELAAGERDAVAEFLSLLGVPAYLEALSGLRETDLLKDVRLHYADGVLSRAQALGYPIDGILRIGNVPTHQLWRDLEGRAAHLPVVSVSHLPFSGLGRASSLCHGQVPDLLLQVRAAVREKRAIRAASGVMAGQRLLERDREIRNALLRLLAEEPSSEPGILYHLSRAIELGAQIYLGNSLPIREWDLAATWHDRGYEISASRGLNGIDGQVSTFLGLARAGRPNWAILGDLTALYDLAGPWPLAQIDEKVSIRLVVINNGGGKIFERMFPQPEFQNRHEIGFAPWATLWKLPYLSDSRVPANLAVIAPARCLIEFRPDPEATRRFWQNYEKI